MTVQLLPKQAELRYVSYPLLIRCCCLKVTFQEIRRYLSNFALVRTILLHPEVAK